ncbi:hypothetical protein PHYPSEUDO_012303 [Phytophthora pseudosyringae]|uniref:Uncharacterized protein n=1 Tax=Phytophthora pseudosyringae TaxID=221518 RepID=A0A8T1W4L2_9STRA|nr:hypothetical protein PHYPSEUDO_012303 [Phytophthora pseudosyringae]
MVVALSTSGAVVRLWDKLSGAACRASCLQGRLALRWRAALASIHMVPFHQEIMVASAPPPSWGIRLPAAAEQLEQSGARDGERGPGRGSCRQHESGASQLRPARQCGVPSSCHHLGAARRHDAAAQAPHKLLELDDNMLHGVVYKAFLGTICWTVAPRTSDAQSTVHYGIVPRRLRRASTGPGLLSFVAAGGQKRFKSLPPQHAQPTGQHDIAHGPVSALGVTVIVMPEAGWLA